MTRMSRILVLALMISPLSAPGAGFRAGVAGVDITPPPGLSMYGYFDYLPTIQAASEGGYGAGDSNTYLEVGAGERLVDHALTRLHEMMGRLVETPEDLNKQK